MIQLIFRIVLICSLSLLFVSVTADAVVPLPSEVTDDIVEPERTELSAQREELSVRRDNIKLSVAIHNVKCSKVAPGSSIMDECRTNQGKLRAEVSEYASAVLDFNKAVLEAPGITDTGQDNNMIQPAVKELRDD